VAAVPGEFNQRDAACILPPRKPLNGRVHNLLSEVSREKSMLL